MSSETMSVIVVVALVIGAAIAIPAAIGSWRDPFRFVRREPKPKPKPDDDPRFNEGGAYGPRKVIAELEEDGRWK